MSGESDGTQRVALSAILTAVAQSSVTIAGGINAVLIGSRYDVSTATDGLFTAYGIYALVVVVAVSARTALVGKLIDREQRFRPFNEVLSAVVWMTLPIGVAFVAIGVPAVSSIAGEGSHDIVLVTLLVLWPAAAGQLVSAISAAMCGVLGDFKTPALAYGGGGVMSVVGFLALEPAIGLDALPIAVLVGTVLTAGIQLVVLRRGGWRGRRVADGLRNAAGWTRTLVLGATYYLCSQTMYLVSVAVAAVAVAAGAATIYTYAFLTQGLVTSLLAASGAFVLAAPIAANWSGDPKDLVPVENDVCRSGFLVLAVLVGAAALVGNDVAKAVLTAFSTSDIDGLVNAFLALTPMTVAALISVVPVIALFAEHRYRSVAVASLVVLALQVPVTIALGTAGTLVAIAIAASLVSIVLAAVLVRLCHGGAATKRMLQLSREALTIGLPATVAYFGARVAADAAGLDEFARDATAFLAGSCALSVVTLVALPNYRAVVTRFAGSLASETKN